VARRRQEADVRAKETREGRKGRFAFPVTLSDREVDAARYLFYN